MIEIFLWNNPFLLNVKPSLFRRHDGLKFLIRFGMTNFIRCHFEIFFVQDDREKIFFLIHVIPDLIYDRFVVWLFLGLQFWGIPLHYGPQKVVYYYSFQAKRKPIVLKLSTFVGSFICQTNEHEIFSEYTGKNSTVI